MMPLQLSQGLYEFLLLWNGESNYNDLFVLKVTFCSCFFPKLSNFSPNLEVTQKSVSMCPMSNVWKLLFSFAKLNAVTVAGWPYEPSVSPV